MTTKRSPRQPPKSRATLTVVGKDGSTTETRLAVLDKSEREAIVDGTRAREMARAQLRFIAVGLNATWDAIRLKYDLPAEFTYDVDSGIVTPRETPSG